MSTSNYRRIVCLGEHNVGKTCFVNRVSTSAFDTTTVPSNLTMPNFYRTATVVDGVPLNYLLADFTWNRLDTQESMQCKDAEGFLVFYDVTDRPTFEKLDHWHQVLVDNKCDKKAILLVGMLS